jgi:hypothetical protein
MKIKLAIISSLLFILNLLIIYYIHIAFIKISVVFYAAIIDAIIASILTGLVTFWMSYFRPLNNFEKSQLLVIWLLFGYGFAISVPTVIDRSLSFYILEKLQQRGGGIKQDRFEEIFTKEYFKEARVIDVRLTEQLESGTIIIKDGCVMLTKKGESIATFGRTFRQNFLPKKRLLLYEYSDDLTNPFRYSTDVINYTCRQN